MVLPKGGGGKWQQNSDSSLWGKIWKETRADAISLKKRTHASDYAGTEI